MTPLTIAFGVLCPDNRRAMRSKHGTIITSRRYKDSKAAIRGAALAWWGRRGLLLVPVAIHARIWFPDNRKRDGGNVMKNLKDALNETVWADDSQVYDERVTRMGVDRKNPRLELTVTAYQQEAA